MTSTAPPVPAPSAGIVAVAARRPRRWVALLLTIVTPGLGHLYLWRTRAALLAWLGVSAAMGVLIACLVTLPGLATLAAGSLLVIGAQVAAAVHAWRSARWPPPAGRPARPRLALAMAGFYAASALAYVAGREWVLRDLAEPYHVPSRSMEPAVLAGDRLLVSPRARAPERDGLIVFRWGGSTYLKRAVGLGGDTLEMRDDLLYRNGGEVVEPYAVNDGSPVPRATRAWGPLVVPPGHLFVLGDDRHDTLDSRHIGFIDADSIVGRPLHVYFSRDPGRRAVRWDRIGHRPR